MIGFLDNLIEEMLSQKMIEELSNESAFFNHVSWQAHEDAATNSASVADYVTTSYFFEDHDTDLEPILNTYPEVFLLSSPSLA